MNRVESHNLFQLVLDSVNIRIAPNYSNPKVKYLACWIERSVISEYFVQL